MIDYLWGLATGIVAGATAHWLWWFLADRRWEKAQQKKEAKKVLGQAEEETIL